MWTWSNFQPFYICRNPDGDVQPWCYIADYEDGIYWRYCDIPTCQSRRLLPLLLTNFISVSLSPCIALPCPWGRFMGTRAKPFHKNFIRTQLLPPRTPYCHAQACFYFNVSCQSLCICLCLSVCVFISFPFGFVACFDSFFFKWAIVCTNYPLMNLNDVLTCGCEPLSMMDCSGLQDFVLLFVYSVGLTHVYKDHLVFNPITFISSTFF